MRKSIVAIGVLILLFIPVSLYATSFTSTYLYGEHKYYADISDSRVFIIGGGNTDVAPGEPPQYKVYIWNTPVDSYSSQYNYNEHGDIQLPYWPGWGNCFADGFPITGEGGSNVWENRRIFFWIDDDLDGNPDPLETVAVRQIPSGALLWKSGLPLVENVTIIGGAQPTIQWDRPNYGGIDGYKIRFFPINSETGLGDTNAGPLFDSGWIPEDGSQTYSYPYTGDLFLTYPELAIAIEAYDNVGDYGLVNRSRYLVNHVVPIPSTLLLFGGGLVGVFGLRKRRRGKASS